jgi:hypothetical protein
MQTNELFTSTDEKDENRLMAKAKDIEFAHRSGKI